VSGAASSQPKILESFFCSRHNREHPTLEKEYEGNDRLLVLYRRKLPIKGWAGHLTCAEKEYVLRVTPWRRKAAERARERFMAKQLVAGVA